MGTWGPGNLDNDYALDELSDRINELVKSLWERASQKNSRESDSYDYTTLFVEFEILFALDNRGLVETRCSVMPTPDDVEQLKLDYIRGWENNIEAVKPSPEHKKKRRETILRTFSRLKRIAKRHHDV